MWTSVIKSDITERKRNNYQSNIDWTYIKHRCIQSHIDIIGNTGKLHNNDMTNICFLYLSVYLVYWHRCQVPFETDGKLARIMFVNLSLLSHYKIMADMNNVGERQTPEKCLIQGV